MKAIVIGSPLPSGPLVVVVELDGDESDVEGPASVAVEVVVDDAVEELRPGAGRVTA